jgi:anion-transporting  ArsA/GET3 family ATPase
LEALSAPERVRDLFDGPFIKRLIQIFSVVGKSRKRRWFGASQRIIDALSRAFGEKLTVELAELMTGLGRIQPRILALAKKSHATLRAPTTQAYVVTVPQPKPVNSALRIISMLEKTGFRVSGVIVNRTPLAPEPTPVGAPQSEELEGILRAMKEESAHKYAIGQSSIERLRTLRPSLPLICLPEFDASRPTSIVRTLALHPSLIKITGQATPVGRLAHG